jgi:sugar lactone lactonase YvrE
VKWTTGRSSPLAPPPEPRAAEAARDAVARPHRQATGAQIYRINPKSFRIEKQFPTAGNRPHGLGWEGDSLWCAESNDNAFYKFDAESGQYSEKIQLADSDPLPHGMTIWDGWMWYCDDVGVVCRLKM